MTDGPHLQLARQELERLESNDNAHIDLTTFMLWIELEPTTTLAGMLELLGNELYRRERFAEGSDVKHIAQRLREQETC